MIEFNVNHGVMVKLTNVGVEELRRQHEELREHFPKLRQFVPPKTDSEGWSNFQMHDLMNKFGHMMVMGSGLPIETEILLEE